MFSEKKNILKITQVNRENRGLKERESLSFPMPNYHIADFNMIFNF